mmetsp:Transcript_11670/g.17681  ORF Transcript_11670/g.17681 Transcript_11670/m.17681 type:complete len:754 (-) Transcript_11670:187-2448(-)
MPPARKKFRAAAIRSGYSSASKRDAACLIPSRSESPQSNALFQNYGNITPRKKVRRRSIRNKVHCQSALLTLPDALLVYIFSFFVCPNGLDMDNFHNIQAVNSKCRALINSPVIWRFIPIIQPGGALNINAFFLVKMKNKGTEGTCYHTRRRSDQAEVALKRARVYPDNEGVPYYMMREISALKKLSHPNICSLDLVNLSDFKLYLGFRYVELTLHDLLYPPSTSVAPVKASKAQTRELMKQLGGAVAYCHRRGVLHRNLKPKHLLLIPGPVANDPLEGARILLSDFALVRMMSNPPKRLTSEVITLWYRPPEILMGQNNYTAAVDVWSMGCIFAELLQGKALFEGLCEVDQIFQIFRTLGTPTTDVWDEFKSMPYYQDPLFPDWQKSRLWNMVRNATAVEFDLLSQCLVYDPRKRLSAAEFLGHVYFIDSDTSDSTPANDIILESPGIELCADALVNVHKTTLPHYAFLRSLEPGAVASCTNHDGNRPGANAMGTSITDKRGDLVYSEEDLEVRSRAVEWVFHVSGRRHDSSLSVRTTYFAIALLDAFFCSTAGDANKKVWTAVSTSSIVGACCMHIASKCEDVSYAGIRDISRSLDFAYEPEEFLLTEEVILNTLQFDFYIPTVIDFLGLFMECLPEIYTLEQQRSLCLYLGELSLLFTICIRFAPSLVATTIVSYALGYTSSGERNRTKGVSWPDSLKKLSGYSYEEDVVPCLQYVRESQRLTPLLPYASGIYTDYSSAETHGVARWPPL